MPKNKKELSIRAKRYVENKIIHGMSGNQAALAAGYSMSAARSSSHTLNYPEIREYMQELMDKAGITDEQLVQKIKDGMDAKKPISAQILVKQDGSVVKKEDEGVIEVEDWASQHKFVETALKLKDRFPKTKVELGGENGQPIPIQLVTYGANDPLSVFASSPDAGGVSRSPSVSSTELASEGEEDESSG